MSAENTAFSIFSFLTFVLVSIPFCWHLEAWNAGMCLYIAWTALGNLVYFANSVIWNGNTTNWAPVWCDISTKIMVGLTIGIPVASLCISRRLYQIATIRTVVTTKADKRRGVIIDLCIGVGIPVLVMVLHYIPQGHRFDILEDFGCLPVTYNTWIAFLVTQAPIIIMTLISGAYLIMSAISFKRREIELQILLSSTVTLSPNRYLRLMCLVGIEVVLTLFLACAGLIYSAHTGFQPWISWADTHSFFSRVDQQPAIQWRSDPNMLVMLELSRWIIVVCGLLFFAFFGFAQEARTNYRKAYLTIVGSLGFHVSSDRSEVENPDIYKGLPNVATKNRVYIRTDIISTRDSDDTFASEISGTEDKPTTPTFLPNTISKELPSLPSTDDIELPALQDLSGFLHLDSLPESQSPTAVSSPAAISMKLSPNQAPSFHDMDMSVLQDVGGFLQPESQTPTAVSSPAAPHLVVLPPPEAPALIPTHSLSPGLTHSSVSTPNINTPPAHRPHSFPVSVTSYLSPPPQIIVLPPPETPIIPHSSASSESMYSMSTATDVSPHGGLFPFPLPPSSRTLRLHPLSASFLDFDTPSASSFLDFDDPPSEHLIRDRLSPDNRV